MATSANPPAKAGGGKVALLIGVGIALAASKTRAAPFVVAVLAAAILFQLLNL